MKLGQLFQKVKSVARSRLRWVVLAIVTSLVCTLVLPKLAHPASSPAHPSVGLFVDRWRSPSPIAVNVAICPAKETSDSRENLLQKAQQCQVAGFYRRAGKLLLEALDITSSDSELDFERLIRDEYDEKDVNKFFSVEPATSIEAEILRSLGDILRTIGAPQTSEIVLKQSLD
ncbi:MAG: hypothetical protein WA882_14560, partial [Geitlerinemataceae cyanobacterium]